MAATKPLPVCERVFKAPLTVSKTQENTPKHIKTPQSPSTQKAVLARGCATPLHVLCRAEAQPRPKCGVQVLGLFCVFGKIIRK